jgi:uncharacterized protein YdcH (DUF465 family)
MSARLFRLTEIYQRIDAALRSEQRRRFPDSSAMNRLKKLKLRVKDLIARISRTPRRFG